MGGLWNVACLLLACASIAQSQSRLDVLNKLFSVIDRNARPHEGGEPDEVKVSMYLNYVRLDDRGNRSKAITTDMYVRYKWNDPRLATATGRRFKLFNDELDKIWIPDLFFRNGYAYAVKEPRPNVHCSISPDGTVWYVQRIIGYSFRCTSPDFVDGKLFCPVFLESFSYTKSEVSLAPLQREIEVDENAFELGEGVTISAESGINYHTNEYTAGTFQEGGLTLVFKNDNASRTDNDSVAKKKRNIQDQKAKKDFFSFFEGNLSPFSSMKRDMDTVPQGGPPMV